MQTIRNSHDLRCAYQVLDMISKSDLVSKSIPEYVIETKRAIRAYHKLPAVQATILRNSGDAMTIVCPLPAHVQTTAAAEHYFDSHLRRTAIPSMYDCTGQLFTVWHKIFYRADRFWAYHRIGIDV